MATSNADATNTAMKTGPAKYVAPKKMDMSSGAKMCSTNSIRDKFMAKSTKNR